MQSMVDFWHTELLDLYTVGHVGDTPSHSLRDWQIALGSPHTSPLAFSGVSGQVFEFPVQNDAFVHPVPSLHCVVVP